jgi:hypothetical protein
MKSLVRTSLFALALNTALAVGTSSFPPHPPHPQDAKGGKGHLAQYCVPHEREGTDAQRIYC